MHTSNTWHFYRNLLLKNAQERGIRALSYSHEKVAEGRISWGDLGTEALSQLLSYIFQVVTGAV